MVIPLEEGVMLESLPRILIFEWLFMLFCLLCSELFIFYFVMAFCYWVRSEPQPKEPSELSQKFYIEKLLEDLALDILRQLVK